ncbi:hypothetical protein EVAR_28420_1 [Eumeta japonica]|uniref:Uncharacterized protein n=1 Tax=Eumeta variegata TaxID=151549 RepID=A0A4C1VBG5_EUMVA|nr:hypothetical protein EVAR_28420_1 [Eumeta japonica]
MTPAPTRGREHCQTITCETRDRERVNPGVDSGRRRDDRGSWVLSTRFIQNAVGETKNDSNASTQYVRRRITRPFDNVIQASTNLTATVDNRFTNIWALRQIGAPHCTSGASRAARPPKVDSMTVNVTGASQSSRTERTRVIQKMLTASTFVITPLLKCTPHIFFNSRLAHACRGSLTVVIAADAVTKSGAECLTSSLTRDRGGLRLAQLKDSSISRARGEGSSALPKEAARRVSNRRGPDAGRSTAAGAVKGALIDANVRWVR